MHLSRRRHTTSAGLLVLLVGLQIACGPIDANNSGGGSNAPVASFTQSATSGTPGLMVQFTDTSAGNVTAWSWDFGGPSPSTEQNPLVTFATAGQYTVRLQVSGPGGTSTTTKTALITVADAPVAGFTCDPVALEGYTPFPVSCTDTSTGDVSSWSWDFGEGGTPSTEQNADYTYTSPDTYTITQTVTGPGGTSQATATATVHELGIDLTPASDTAAAPVDVFMLPVDPAGRLGSFTWLVDGVNLGTQPTLNYRFLEPGTHTVQVFGIRITPPMVGSVTVDYVVQFGPPVAAIDPTVVGGFGPFTAQLLDASGGQIDKWEWSFGDGEGCIHPADQLPDPAPAGVTACGSNSPTHTWEDVGSYDVSLSVTGPSTEGGPSDSTDSTTNFDHVRVYIGDPSFELQAAGGVIGGAWTSLRPADETVSASHVALTAGGGTDHGMPSDGIRWASLDGLGTDGGTDVDVVENGIQQTFLRPPTQPVLEFDYSLLYAEPPAAGVLDAVAATVSDGVTTVVIPSAHADTQTPYAGESTRYPTRDGSIVRITPRLTASIDLEEAFPASTDLTPFTLTIRTTNANNGQRSPRAYVDDVRFTTPLAALPVDFDVDTDPVLAGEPADFTDISCPTGAGGCQAPTSWRWDFDTQNATTPPAASGSGDQNPIYVFEEAGVYDVTLLARRANAEGTVTKQVTVLEPVLAGFDIATAEPWVAPASIDFLDTSTEDPVDPIVAWSWDFGGWGTPAQQAAQNPTGVMFGAAGPVTVTLTVTTSQGATSSTQQDLLIE